MLTQTSKCYYDYLSKMKFESSKIFEKKKKIIFVTRREIYNANKLIEKFDDIKKYLKKKLK